MKKRSNDQNPQAVQNKHYNFDYKNIEYSITLSKMNFACGKSTMRAEIEKLKRLWVCTKSRLGWQGVDRVWKILL